MAVGLPNIQMDKKKPPRTIEAQALLHLDIPDLLRIQTVQSHFRDVTIESIKLQQKLFFKPISNNGSCEPRMNPVLANIFPVLFTLNKRVDCTDLEFLHTICRLKWFQNPQSREKMLRADASWRHMFPVQPPTKLEVIKINTHEKAIGSRFRAFDARIGSQYDQLQSEGLRMGLLYDLVTQLDAMHPDPTFFVHWQMFPLVEHLDEWQLHSADIYSRYVDWESSYYEAILNGNPELKNSLTIHHNHDTTSDGNEPRSLGLKMASPITISIDQSPSTMLYFPNRDPSYPGTRWDDYGTWPRTRGLRLM
jgi:hypothetical protein